ncbi:MAG: hypothetical protein V4592_14125 [Bacteroidota bacterium]
MPATPIAIPKIAMRSIAGGLLLMAFFTTMWSGVASASLTGGARIVEMMVFMGMALLFVIYGIYFFIVSKRFQNMTEEDKAEGKKMGIWYGIIFGLEGITIPIAAFICIQLHHTDLVLPAIALVVGLHFYPMGKIFNRSIDYYLATWATLIAIVAIILTLKHTVLPLPILAILGMGMALATMGYGMYMIRVGKGYLES